MLNEIKWYTPEMTKSHYGANVIVDENENPAYVSTIVDSLTNSKLRENPNFLYLIHHVDTYRNDTDWIIVGYVESKDVPTFNKYIKELDLDKSIINSNMDANNDLCIWCLRLAYNK